MKNEPFSLFQRIKDLINRLKKSGKSYNEMLDTLTEEGLEQSDARKLLRMLGIGNDTDEDKDKGD